MREDSIIKETRVAREELLARFGYDLDALCAYLQELETQSEKKSVTLELRRPASDRKVL